ncbi:MAG: hypothetical protein ACRDJ4_14650 [Actinomycetota bacterium]
MTRILDTIPTFEAYARKAFPQGPLIREILAGEEYHRAYPEVFDSFFSRFTKEGMRGIVWELSQVRSRAKEAASVLPAIIEEVEGAARELLDARAVPDPQHVLMVGSLATNATVGRIGDDVAVFHCLEWFQNADAAKTLVAHEDTHALHEALLVGERPDDPAWNAFYEGIAIQASRAIAPGRPQEEYFWYGVTGFEDWLPWCRRNRNELIGRFSSSLDDEAATEIFFGAGFVEKRWRVGYFIGDLIVAAIDRPLSELVRLGVDEARGEVVTALKTFAAEAEPESDPITPRSS